MIDDRVFIHPASAGRVGTDQGVDRRRKASPDLLEILQHARARPVKIRAILEYNEHVGIAEHGLGAHGFYVRRGKQRRHDRVGNLILDDIGWFLPRRMNDHLHVGDVRQGIQRNPAQRPDAGQHQEKRSGEDEEAIASAQIDPAGDHLHASFHG